MAYFEALSDDQFNSLIANRLKEDRKATKVSQEDVANGTGYSKSKVKNIENGRRMAMASIVKRGKRYAVVYNYINDRGERKQKWESYKTLT